MRCKSVFTSHSLRRTCNSARRQTAMQSHGGPQLVAELPQRFKKKQATRFVATIGSATQGAQGGLLNQQP